MNNDERDRAVQVLLEIAESKTTNNQIKIDACRILLDTHVNLSTINRKIV